MEEEYIKEVILGIVKKEVLPIFLEMLEKSEARIDMINAAVNKFSETSQSMITTIDKFVEYQSDLFKSMERSRDVAQNNNTELIRVAMESTKMVESIRNDQKQQLMSYKEELKSAKARHDELFHSYMRLAEGPRYAGSGSNTSEIKISNK